MRHESFDRLAAHLEEPDDVVRRAITQPNPDHLRWRPEQDTQPVKVLVLGHDDESVIASIGPDCTVRGGGQADLTDMDGTGVQVSERVNKTGRQILVEKAAWVAAQAAGLLTTRRSRSAANARQARMSSRVSCGKSARISSSRIPDAR